jgi:hypothetical protein
MVIEIVGIYPSIRWWFSIKHGDFPSKNGGCPMKNGDFGDFPVRKLYPFTRG